MLPWKTIGLALGAMVWPCCSSQCLQRHSPAPTSSNMRSTERAPLAANAVRKLGLCWKTNHKPDRSCRRTRLQCPDDDKHLWDNPAALVGTKVRHTPACLVVDSVVLLQSWCWHPESLKIHYGRLFHTFSMFLGILKAGACIGRCAVDSISIVIFLHRRSLYSNFFSLLASKECRRLTFLWHCYYYISPSCTAFSEQRSLLNVSF